MKPVEKKHSAFAIAGAVAAYWTISILLVFTNKVVMDKDASIPAPIFVTFYQCIITTLICWVMGELSSKRENAHEKESPDGDALSKASESMMSSFLSQFPKQEVKLDTCVKVFPLSLVFVGMITMNNLCLYWVEVSFYNVARSLTIVFNVIISYYLLGQNTSMKTMLALGIVISGFIIGIDGELNFSFEGTLFGVISSLMVCLNGIFTKKVFPLVDNNKWKLAFTNNFNACIMFFPMIFIFQEDHVIMANSHHLLSLVYWAKITLTGILGFGIGIVAVMQITMTSPLTHNISGTAKAAFQSFLAVYIWRNPLTYKGAYGIIGTLSGSLVYTYIRMKENDMKVPPKLEKEENPEEDVPLKEVTVDADDAANEPDGPDADDFSPADPVVKDGVGQRK